MTDEELRERLSDIVAELREVRRLIEHPSTQARAARLYAALAEHLDADDSYFEREDPFDWRLDNAELSAALDALGLQEPAALGYWLRDRKGAEHGGFRVRRDGRGWRLEMTGHVQGISTDSVS